MSNWLCVGVLNGVGVAYNIEVNDDGESTRLVLLAGPVRRVIKLLRHSSHPRARMLAQREIVGHAMTLITDEVIANGV